MEREAKKEQEVRGQKLANKAKSLESSRLFAKQHKDHHQDYQVD